MHQTVCYINRWRISVIAFYCLAKSFSLCTVSIDNAEEALDPREDRDSPDAGLDPVGVADILVLLARELRLLPATELRALPATELRALPAAELLALPATELRAVPTTELRAVPTTELRALPTTELRALPAGDEPKTEKSGVIWGLRYLTQI